LIQVLFSFSWDEVARSVAWIEDEHVRCRVLADTGIAFERWSTSCTLTEEWAMESSYVFFRPAIVPSLNVAFVLLGCTIGVIEFLPQGPLAPPVRWRLAGKK
jgi:hypothetical protein